MTVPAMAAIEMPFEEGEVEVGGGVELAVVEGAVCEAPGGDCVEDGDRPVIQLLSSEKPTIRTSELPPCRPWESVIKNIIEVPRATDASQEKEVGPVGGLKENEFPPGMTPYIDTGCTACV